MLAGAAVLAVVVGAAFIPFLTRERVVHAGTPTPPPLFERSPLSLGARDVACVRDFVLPSDAEVLRVIPLTDGRPPAPLRITLRATGYRFTTTVRDYGDGVALDVRTRPPARALPAVACLRNTGPGRVALVATTEARSSSRATTLVNDRPVAEDVALLFLERQPASVLSRLGDVMRRAAAFRPSPIGAWTFWTLAALVIVGIPAATFWALHRAVTEEDG
jgi:hypothetical protein